MKPFKPVLTSTISRWIKAMLQEAGIEANAHSTRFSSTSKLLQQVHLLQRLWTQPAGQSNLHSRDSIANLLPVQSPSVTLFYKVCGLLDFEHTVMYIMQCHYIVRIINSAILRPNVELVVVLYMMYLPHP